MQHKTESILKDYAKDLTKDKDMFKIKNQKGKEKKPISNCLVD